MAEGTSPTSLPDPVHTSLCLPVPSSAWSACQPPPSRRPLWLSAALLSASSHCPGRGLAAPASPVHRQRSRGLRAAVPDQRTLRPDPQVGWGHFGELPGACTFGGRPEVDPSAAACSRTRSHPARWGLQGQRWDRCGWRTSRKGDQVPRRKGPPTLLTTGRGAWGVGQNQEWIDEAPPRLPDPQPPVSPCTGKWPAQPVSELPLGATRACVDVQTHPHRQAQTPTGRPGARACASILATERCRMKNHMRPPISETFN